MTATEVAQDVRAPKPTTNPTTDREPVYLTLRQHEFADLMTEYIGRIFPDRKRCEIRGDDLWIPMSPPAAFSVFASLIRWHFAHVTPSDHPVFEHVFEYGTSISLNHPALTGDN